MLRYLLTLLLTIAIEGGVVYLLGFRKSQYMLAITAINIITHPVLNYLILVLGYLNVKVTFLLIVILEILVVIVEWQLLVYVFRGPKGRFLITSLLANAASFFFGVLLFWT
jgi:hypothetical protein